MEVQAIFDSCDMNFSPQSLDQLRNVGTYMKKILSALTPKKRIKVYVFVYYWNALSRTCLIEILHFSN